MSQDEMRTAISEAIENSGYQVSYIASQISTSPSNLSNILNPKRNIPLSLLQSLMFFLEDEVFTAKAIEYFSNKKIMPKNITKIPAMQFIAAEKEELERKELEGATFKKIISQPIESWSSEDIEFMKNYDKELSEEVISENGYHSMLSEILKSVGG